MSSITISRRTGLLAVLIWTTAILPLAHGQGGSAFGKPTYRSTPHRRASGPTRREAPQRLAQAPPRTEIPPAALEADPTPRSSGTRSGMDSRMDLIDAPVDEPFDDSGSSRSYGPPELETTGPWTEDDPLEISPETIEHGGDPLFHDGQCDASCMDEPAPVYSTGTWFRRGDWFTIGEFAYWTKDESRKVGIAFDGSVVPDGRIATPSSLSTRDAKHKFEPGLSLTLGRFLGRDAANRDHLFEIHFLGLFQWEGEATIRGLTGPSLDTLLNGGTFGSNRVIVPGQTVAGFTNTDVQSFTYDSDLNNLELNYSVRSRPGRDQMAMQPDGNWVRFKNAGCVKSVLGGLRLMRINELAQYLSRDDVLGTVNTVESGIYRVNTDNDVFGPQIGMDVADSYDEWSWGLRGKVGGLINLTDRRSIVSTTLTTFTNNQPTTTFAERQEHINEEQFAFLAEVGAFGAYQLRPNLYVRAGYDFLFVSGLAVAPENMALAPAFMPMNISGDMIYHGGTVGFEALW